MRAKYVRANGCVCSLGHRRSPAPDERKRVPQRASVSQTHLGSLRAARKLRLQVTQPCPGTASAPGTNAPAVYLILARKSKPEYTGYSKPLQLVFLALFIAQTGVASTRVLLLRKPCVASVCTLDEIAVQSRAKASTSDIGILEDMCCIGCFHHQELRGCIVDKRLFC